MPDRTSAEPPIEDAVEPSAVSVAPALTVTREPVDGMCSACGASQLRRYPVLAHNGWLTVVKCQVCLESRSREPWRRLGWLELLEDTIQP